MAKSGAAEFGRIVLAVQADDAQLIETLNRDTRMVADAATNMQQSLDTLTVSAAATTTATTEASNNMQLLGAATGVASVAVTGMAARSLGLVRVFTRFASVLARVIGVSGALTAGIAAGAIAFVVYRKEIAESIASLELWYKARNAMDPDPGFGARLGRAGSFLEIRRKLIAEEQLLLGQVTPLDLVRDKLVREREARLLLRFQQRQANIPPDEYAPPPRLTRGQIDEIIVRKQRILELEERTRDALREQAALEARIRGREPRTAREARDAIVLAVQEMQRLSAARARMERVYEQYVTAMGLVGTRAPFAVRLAEVLGLLKEPTEMPGALTTRAVTAFAFPGGGRFGGAGAPDPMAQRRQQMAEERTKRARWSEEHLRAIRVAVETGGGAGP